MDWSRFHSPTFDPIISEYSSLEKSTAKLRQPVYTLSIDVFFNAKHYISSSGKKGPVHAHSFRVNVIVRQKVEPGQNYAFGFGEFRALVQSHVSRFNDLLLNDIPPFSDTFEPATENLAKVIYRSVEKSLTGDLHLISVTIWESPTASVTYSEESI